jgi:hypothetical protein
VTGDWVGAAVVGDGNTITNGGVDVGADVDGSIEKSGTLVVVGGGVGACVAANVGGGEGACVGGAVVGGSVNGGAVVGGSVVTGIAGSYVSTQLEKSAPQQMSFWPLHAMYPSEQVLRSQQLGPPAAALYSVQHHWLCVS